jgi:hypothetical protein
MLCGRLALRYSGKFAWLNNGSEHRYRHPHPLTIRRGSSSADSSPSPVSATMDTFSGADKPGSVRVLHGQLGAYLPVR